MILPVLYDDETHEIDNDNYNEIISIVRGLAANDERIIEYFKDKSDKKVTKRIEGSSLFDFDFSSDLLNEKDLTEQLQIKIWESLSKFNWMDFEEARDYVRSLKLNYQKDWNIFCKSGKKPNNIPSNPDKKYKEAGYLSMPDFLGTKIGFDGFDYLPFIKAREIVKGYNFKNTNEWKQFLKSEKKPTNIPYEPNKIYENDGWISFSDFIGTNRISNLNRVFLTFEDARIFVRSLNLKTTDEWLNYTKSVDFPINIPVSPGRTYKNEGWLSIPDWIGANIGFTGTFDTMKFEEAREFVWKLKLKKQKDWNLYCLSGEKPKDIPSNPDKAYKENGWLSFPDWLGTEIGFNGYEYLQYDEAKEFVKKLGLASQSDWSKYLKSGNRPKFIPSSPGKLYKNKGWVNWGDWLGTDRIADKYKIYRTFDEAKKYIQKLEIKSQKEWNAYAKSGGEKPDDIPYKPQRTYKDNGWKGWAYFLGKEK